MACASLRLARVCAEDAFNYAIQRETFGSPLIQKDAIQSKIFKFGLMIEPAYAFMEQLVNILELTKDRPVDDVKIGGMTALLKVMSTRALEKSVREAQQIFGGAGYNKAGKGARVEQISRDARVHVVGGGSEEIMQKLALRRRQRLSEADAKHWRSGNQKSNYSLNLDICRRARRANIDSESLYILIRWRLRIAKTE